MTIKFGTDGWRAIMADEFTFENVRIVSQALANYILAENAAADGIVIGRDNRFLAEEFAGVVAEVLTANGIRVMLSRAALPTPVTAHAVLDRHAFGAVMLTASHNPPAYNGIKFIPFYGGPATPEITAKIEAELQRVEGKKVVKLPQDARGAETIMETIEPKESYLQKLQEVIDTGLLRRNPGKVVVNPLFGAGIGYLEDFLSALGWDVSVINNYRDPLFGGKVPEPSAEVLDDLAQLVREEEAVLGLALDGDADRFGVIDADGNFYHANRVLAVIYYHLLENRKILGPVARTVATTHLLDRIAAAYDTRVLETPVGFKYIGKCLREGALLGGEESGGLSIRGHLPEKDGILAGLLVAEAVAASGSLGQIWREIEEKFGKVFNQRLDCRVQRRVKEIILEKVRQYSPVKLAGLPVVERLTVDGTKLLLADGSWTLIRPSGTEPLFRVYVESDSLKTMKLIQEEVLQELSL